MSNNAVLNLRGMILTVLMLLSGFAGISYEILYGRILGNLIGDQFAVSASVLVTFLLGIGIGSVSAWRLWKHLWLIEGLIGVYGALFALSENHLDTLLYTSFFPGSLLAGVVVCVVLLIIPAVLIGCSIPLFVAYLDREISGSIFSRVYAVYNVGAGLTALFIEFFALRWFGIHGAVIGFACINLVVAACLYRFRYQDMHQATVREYKPFISRHEWLALVLASVASAVFQLFMIKLAEMFLGPFRESFALVLSIVLLGIAFGTVIVKRFRLGFGSVLSLAMFGLLLLLAGMGFASNVYAHLYAWMAGSYMGLVALKWLFLFLLMGLPSLCFGATIPALLNRQGDVSRESGQLLFVASLANAAGFLLMVFLLHRFLDYGVQLLVMVAIVALAIAVYYRFSRMAVAGAAISIVCAGGLFYGQWNENLLYLGYTKFHSAEDLATAKEDISFPNRFKGYQDVFSINWMDGTPFFFINGYISIPLNNPSEKVVGALSSMYAPRDDQALVLGLGSGATASTVGLAFAHTDVVEINPVVRKNLFRMKQWNFDIEANPNVNIIVDDAIHYTKITDKKYSMILNTVTTPLYFSSSKLYTKDFLDVIHDRLTPDGIYVTWMDSRIGDKGVDIVLNTLARSFKHCAIFYVKSAYFLLICSDEIIRPIQATTVAGIQELRDDLLRKYRILVDWLPYQLLNADAFMLRESMNGAINTNDHPNLEFEMAGLTTSGIHKFKARLIKAIDLPRIKAYSNPGSNIFPAGLIKHADRMISDSSIDRSLKKVSKNILNTKRKNLAELIYWKNMAISRGKALDDHKYGYWLYRNKQFRASIKQYRKALALNPKQNNANYNIAISYTKLGELEKALKFYAKELSVDSDDQDVPYEMGVVYMQQKRYSEAIDSFRLATEMGYTSTDLDYSEITALAASGKCQEANVQLSALLKNHAGFLSRVKLRCARTIRGTQLLIPGN